MLRQALKSNSCAVCAVGNLLLLYGTTRTRAEIANLICGPFTGRLPLISFPELAAAATKCFPEQSLVWRRYHKFSFDRIGKDLGQVTAAGVPVLLAYSMRHFRKNWTGVHCVVVVGVDASGIQTIDSLGRRSGRWPNSAISPNESKSGWRVIGAPLIVTRRPARILLGLPPLPKEGHLR